MSRSERGEGRSQDSTIGSVFLQQLQGRHGVEGLPRSQPRHGHVTILRRPQGSSAPAPPQPQVCIHYPVITVSYTFLPAVYGRHSNMHSATRELMHAQPLIHDGGSAHDIM